MVRPLCGSDALFAAVSPNWRPAVTASHHFRLAQALLIDRQPRHSDAFNEECMARRRDDPSLTRNAVIVVRR